MSIIHHNLRFFKNICEILIDFALFSEYYESGTVVRPVQNTEEITDLQKRRADNIIWNCAKDYSFAPDFKAYSRDGDADIYWNIIFGAARHHYDYKKLEKLFAMLDRYEGSDAYENIFWNALEPVLFEAEVSQRPVLRNIRPEPAETELNFSSAMTTDELVETAREFFYTRYGLTESGRTRRRFKLPHFRRMSVDSFLQGRGGYIVHDKELYDKDVALWNGEFSLSTKLKESELRDFLETKFGKSIYPPEKVAELEKQLCSGNHKYTHLLYTRGEVVELHGIYNTFELLQRKLQAEQIEKNRKYFEQNLAQNMVSVSKLSTNIMNSVLLYMQPAPVKADSGAVNPALAWRAAKLDDNRIFMRTENANAGDMSVDILLDASHSQRERVEKITSQAYIIAEALSRCSVPCRLMSFCSMSGFTVMRLFNDYTGHDNSSIFDYVAEGCSRDGLAVRAAGNLMAQAPYEHKMLIILSDVKPLDVANIKKSERDVGVSYDEVRALADTAHEVRRLRNEGISVICVFTGEDEGLPSAKMVYGSDFVRIRDFSLFADTVGRLIRDQIKNYSM